MIFSDFNQIVFMFQGFVKGHNQGNRLCDLYFLIVDIIVLEYNCVYHSRLDPP